MLQRLIIAICIGVLTGIICFLLGAVLTSMNVPPLEALGHVLKDFAWAIGLIAGVLAFFTGRTSIL